MSDQAKINDILKGLQDNRLRRKAQDSAYNVLMKRQAIDALDEPYLLFGALMAEILKQENRADLLEARIAKMENPNG